MKLFHGSTVAVTIPRLLEKQRFLDFGSGFYTTTNQKQAERWAEIKQKRELHSKAVVSTYQVPTFTLADSSLTIREFVKADEEGLDFVFENRKGKTQHSFDIVIGPVANDAL